MQGAGPIRVAMGVSFSPSLHTRVLSVIDINGVLNLLNMVSRCGHVWSKHVCILVLCGMLGGLRCYWGTLVLCEVLGGPPVLCGVLGGSWCYVGC